MGTELGEPGGAAEAPVFLLEGEYWTIGYAGRTVRIRDAKGLRYLSELLIRPGSELPAREILGLGQAEGADEERARLSVTKRIRSALTRIREHHPSLGEHLGASIRTGRLCAYLPDPRLESRWVVTSAGTESPAGSNPSTVNRREP